MSTSPARSAVKFDLFAHAAHKRKIEKLDDLSQIITLHIGIAHLARVVDELMSRGRATKGERPPYPTEVMVRTLVPKHLYNLSDEQADYQLLDRMSNQRFCLLTDSANLHDRDTIWHYQERLSAGGATALFQALDGQWLCHGYLARCRQIIDATLAPAPIQHFTKAFRGQKGRNKRIAKTRTRMEHPFAQMRHLGVKLIRAIGQVRVTVAMTMMAACCNLKRLAKLLDDEVITFYSYELSETKVCLHEAKA